MAYTDKATVEAFLNRSLTANEETILPLAIAAVEAFINDALGASYASGDAVTRYFDGGRKYLLIDAVRDITKIELVDSDADNTVLHEYDLDEEYEQLPANTDVKTYIYKRAGAFPTGVANIAVTGKFSLADDAPDDIKYLATYLVSKLFSKGVTGDLKRESIEGYSREWKTYSTNDEVVQSILNKYLDDEVYL